MKQTLRLLNYVPRIKFVGGPHTHAAVSSTPQPHPMAPEGKLPSIVQSKAAAQYKPIELKEGEVLFRYELPKRFRYSPPSALEAEQIDSGGATFIY